MSGLAEILLNLGYEVSGSDISETPITQRLKESGLEFFKGHDARNLGDAAIAVVSAAVEDTNVEVAEALNRNIPVLHRSDLLADLVRMKPHAVVVGGTHGKTTTTSMISAILDRAGLNATSIVGGILRRSGTNARWGTGDYIVAEADEHDGSFLRLRPTIGTVTNIDAEHLEFYGTIDQIKRAFTDFCNHVPFYGYSILCWDDPNCRDILDKVESVYVTYGLDEGASLRGTNLHLANVDPTRSKLEQFGQLRTVVDVASSDERLNASGKLGQIEINAVGKDNVRNALAAVTVGLCLGLDFELIADGLAQFDGVQRRLQVACAARGVTVIEDYAHHPTEIASALEAMRWIEPRRIVCVFQPHLYSRTKHFCEEFARVLATTDRAIVTDIYPSREKPMPGVDAGLIVDIAKAGGAGHVDLIRDMMAVPESLAPELEEGDVVLVLGAGDVNRIVKPLCAAL